MQIDNYNFDWPDPDLHSCEPVHAFSEVQDWEMRVDTFPNRISNEAAWELALRDLAYYSRGRHSNKKRRDEYDKLSN